MQLFPIFFHFEEDVYFDLGLLEFRLIANPSKESTGRKQCDFDINTLCYKVLAMLICRQYINVSYTHIQEKDSRYNQTQSSLNIK